MDLAEAFRTVQLLDEAAPAEKQGRVAEAIDALHKALASLAEKHLQQLPKSIALDREDLAQIVLMRLVEGGPREAMDGPREDGEARKYLCVCLTNELRSQIRKAKPRTRAEERWREEEAKRQEAGARGDGAGSGSGSNDDDPSDDSGGCDAEEPGASIDDLREALRALETRVIEVVVPCARASFSRSTARANFDANFEELRGLAAGELTMGRHVDREVESDAAAGRVVPAELLPKAALDQLAAGTKTLGALLEEAPAGSCAHEAFERFRQRIYRRHTRVREALLVAIDMLHEVGTLSDRQAANARRYVEHYLNRRTGG